MKRSPRSLYAPLTENFIDHLEANLDTLATASRQGKDDRPFRKTDRPDLSHARDRSVLLDMLTALQAAEVILLGKGCRE